jgi:phage host-nuclease inhibitor protein Gam
MAKNKRVKSDLNLITITSWQQADEMLRSIGDLTGQIAQSESNAKYRIDAIKEALAGDVAARMEIINLNIKSLEAYAVNNKDDFGGKKSRALNFGTLGWRKSSSISVGKNTLGLIKDVFKSKVKQLIRIKESVDKDALAKLTDEQLAAVDARRKEKDVFYAEPTEVKAVDLAG